MTLTEVVVLGTIVGVTALMFALMLPRGRESARRSGCARNLMQIGQALDQYHQAARHLPMIELGGGPGPLATLLENLGVVDFNGLAKDEKARGQGPVGPLGERRVTGFTCPSDTRTYGGAFPAPISYRANAGVTPSGVGGPFSPGVATRLEGVEAADGLAFTASFTERLVGTGTIGQPHLANYASLAGPIDPSGCGPIVGPAWRGDSGSSWLRADWRSTLSGYDLTPGAGLSCLASDGQTALMGASSGHLDLVQVLLLDGSVRPYTPRVAPQVWRALGTNDDRR